VAAQPPASGAEGARRVLAVLQAFSPRQHTLTARELSELTAIPLPSMYRYIALLRDTGLLTGDDHGAYHLSARLIALARATSRTRITVSPHSRMRSRITGSATPVRVSAASAARASAMSRADRW
jgi:DNA-binding IclR family transcriptional regulator